MRLFLILGLLVCAGCATETPLTQTELEANPFFRSFQRNPRFAPSPSQEGIWLLGRGWKVVIRPDEQGGASVAYGDRAPETSELSHRAGTLSPAAYRALWERLEQLKVWSLPSHTTSERRDPYGLGLTVYVQRGGKALCHLIPRFCRVTRASFTPTPDERRRMERFVAAVRQTASHVAQREETPPPLWGP